MVSSYLAIAFIIFWGVIDRFVFSEPAALVDNDSRRYLFMIMTWFGCCLQRAAAYPSQFHRIPNRSCPRWAADGLPVAGCCPLWFGFAVIVSSRRFHAPDGELSASNFQIVLGTDNVMQWWFLITAPMSFPPADCGRVIENLADDIRNYRNDAGADQAGRDRGGRVMTDGTWVTLISIGVTFLFMLGVPVLLVIAYWVIGMLLRAGPDTRQSWARSLLNVFNKGFALLAMPLFILTGDLINRSGIARRLSDFAYACLGWMRGGLAMASLGACGLFAAISGSNSATTATIGSMLHPEMVKGGYDERFSAATAAAGGTVGIIIPPSIIFIVYGFLMNLPISDLFVAGILPGRMMVIGMQLACWIICRRNGWGFLIPSRSTGS